MIPIGVGVPGWRMRGVQMLFESLRVLAASSLHVLNARGVPVMAHRHAKSARDCRKPLQGNRKRQGKQSEPPKDFEYHSRDSSADRAGVTSFS